MNQAVYFCIALSLENYADAKVRSDGRKLSITSGVRKLEFKFNRSVKVMVEEEKALTVVYIRLISFFKKLGLLHWSWSCILPELLTTVM